MCHNIIENCSCGHQNTDPIPCDGKFDTGSCNAPPERCQDSISDVPYPCNKCKAKQDEDDWLAEEIKKISTDPRMAPEPKTASKPAGGYGFYKSRIRWKHCGHVDHPAETDIERESAEDLEWLEEEGLGSCYGCSEQHPEDLAAMKARGELKGDDPWGAMKAPAQVAAGGSGSSKPQSNQAIALGVPQSQRRAQANDDLPPHPATLGHDDEDEETLSRPSSPDQPPTLTKSKGKGRAGKPEETYASRYGAAPPDSDDDDAPASSSEEEEDDVRQPKTYAPNYSDESDDDSHPPRGRSPGSRGGRPPANTHRRARSTSSSYSRGEDSDDDHDKTGVPDWSAPPPGGPPPAAH